MEEPQHVLPVLPGNFERHRHGLGQVYALTGAGHPVSGLDHGDILVLPLLDLHLKTLHNPVTVHVYDMTVQVVAVVALLVQQIAGGQRQTFEGAQPAEMEEFFVVHGYSLLNRMVNVTWAGFSLVTICAIRRSTCGALSPKLL